MSVPIQTEPAEGAREDDASAKTTKGPQPSQSAEDPAEGADDAPGADRGSPRG
ncbi:MAG: hypothetical protein JWL91_1923 [Sphingomonas bacterium]|jgi:hypothetical protein|nr:hypothetical protein [Sphingomonas bacterium]